MLSILVREFINISLTGVNIIMNEKNNLCSCGGDSNSYTSIALALMQQELPQYIQYMLKAAGYEKLQTIAKTNIDLGSKPNDADRMFRLYQITFSKWFKASADFIITIN